MASNPANESAPYIEELRIPFKYPVYFTRGVLEPGNPILADVMRRAEDPAPQTLVYLDSGLVAAHRYLPDAIQAYAARHADAMRLAAEPRVLPGGEAVKDGWQFVLKVVDEIAEHRLCRHSFVVAAGGGAFLDVVGLAASLVHRGVRLIRLPSTTLAQGDGGVGVKNGIDAHGVKNLIGTFAPPFAVINDLAFLATLPHDVLLDGVTEAFKVAIIKDVAFFRFLTEAAPRLAAGEPAVVEETVRRTAILHLDHIRDAGDPFELGAARPLDFGHWAAHRLEGLSNYAIRHGQAVAVGIALDSHYAWRKGFLARAALDNILDAFRSATLPTWHPLLAERGANGKLLLLDGLEQFREHLGGRLCVTLPNGLGRRIEVHEMDLAMVEEGIGFLGARG